MLKINSSDKVSIKRLPNTPGYDGHSLRAYNYWKEQIHINQVEESTRCFEVNGIRFTEFDEIVYKGIAYNGLDFYNKFTFHSVNS